MRNFNFPKKYVDLPDLIRTRRANMGYSLKNLADKLGTTYVTLGNLERGYHPAKVDMLYDLSQHLGFDIKFVDKETKEEILFTYGNGAN
jgi:transcriptional regulator with XRE-family HTH domain